MSFYGAQFIKKPLIQKNIYLVPSDVNPEQTENCFSQLLSCFDLILNNQSSKVSFQKTYNLVYKLCKEQGLNKKVRQAAIYKFEQDLNSELANLITKCCSQQVKVQVTYFLLSSKHKLQKVLQILMYLQNNPQQKKAGVPLKLILNRLVFQGLLNQQAILRAFLKQLSQLSIEGKIDQCKEPLTLLLQFDNQNTFITQKFVPYHLETVIPYYDKLYQSKIQKGIAIKSFVTQAIEMLKKERQLIDFFQRKHTSSQCAEISLTQGIFCKIISKHQDYILNSDSNQIFQEMIPIVFQLFSYKGQEKMEHFQKWCCNYLQTQLRKVSLGDNQLFLDSILQHYFKIIETSTYRIITSPETKQCLQQLYKRLRLTFENFLNNQGIKFPQRLNHYIFSSVLVIKDQNSAECHMQTEVVKRKQVEKCITLIKLLRDKDQFEVYYRMTLAKNTHRIGKGVNGQFLLELVKALQAQCGGEWVFKLLSMSKSLSQFNRIDNQILRGNTFNIVVFDESSLPSILQITSPGIAPQLLALAKDAKCDFIGANPTKTLKLHPLLGTVHLLIRYSFNVSINVLLNTCQATLVLTLVKLKGKLNLLEFCKVYKYEVQDVKNQVSKLIKKLFLKFVDKEQSEIELNEQFQRVQKQGKNIVKDYIDLTCEEDNLVFVEQGSQVTKTERQITIDRRCVIQSFLIKTIKNQKIISGDQWVKQTKQLIEQKGFEVNPVTILKTIDHLLEREYIKLDAEGKYIYIP